MSSMLTHREGHFWLGHSPDSYRTLYHLSCVFAIYLACMVALLWITITFLYNLPGVTQPGFGMQQPHRVTRRLLRLCPLQPAESLAQLLPWTQKGSPACRTGEPRMLLFSKCFSERRASAASQLLAQVPHLLAQHDDALPCVLLLGESGKAIPAKGEFCRQSVVAA